MPIETMLLKETARLPKVIDARTHGLIDYCHSAFFFGMALLCRKKNSRASTAAFLTGAFICAEALLTDYPLGAEPVISFEMHGSLDRGLAASSLAIPKIFGFAGTAAATVFKMNAFVEATVVGLTDFNSSRAHDEKPAA